MRMVSQANRKKVVHGKLKADIRDIISMLCRYKNIEIIDGAVCEDHIHLSVAILSKHSILKFMGYLQGKSTQIIYDRHPELQSSGIWHSGQENIMFQQLVISQKML